MNVKILHFDEYLHHRRNSQLVYSYADSENQTEVTFFNPAKKMHIFIHDLSISTRFLTKFSVLPKGSVDEMLIYFYIRKFT